MSKAENEPRGDESFGMARGASANDVLSWLSWVTKIMLQRGNYYSVIS